MLNSIYNNIPLWVFVTIVLVLVDYGLIFFIKQKKTNSKNVYFKLNMKYGFYYMIIPRAVYLLAVFFNFISKNKLDHEHGKTIIIIYFIIVCTLCYDAINSKSTNQ